MPISKSHGKKAPSQNPVDFYKSQQSSGVQKVPDQLKGGPQRENVFGKKDLSKS